MTAKTIETRSFSELTASVWGWLDAAKTATGSDRREALDSAFADAKAASCAARAGENEKTQKAALALEQRVRRLLRKGTPNKARGKAKKRDTLGLYGATSKIEPSASRGEIEKMLTRYGAGQFAYRSNPAAGTSTVAFTFGGRLCRLEMPVGKPEDFEGRRDPEAALAQDERRRWRVLALLVRARLETVAAGVSSMEDVWLPDTVLQSNETVAEFIGPETRNGGLPILAASESAPPQLAPSNEPIEVTAEIVETPSPAPRRVPVAHPKPTSAPPVQKPPTAGPARLVALPMADVRRAEDLWTCPEIRATLTAGKCLSQRRAHTAAGRGSCANCSLGLQIAAQIGASAA